jgi:hypothetical protein
MRLPELDLGAVPRTDRFAGADIAKSVGSIGKFDDFNALAQTISKFCNDRADQTRTCRGGFRVVSLASVMGPPCCHEHGTTWMCG